MLAEIIFYALTGVTLVYAFYKWATVNKDYFVKQQLKHMEPKFLIGNMMGLFMKRYTPADFMDSMYYRFPKEKYAKSIVKFYRSDSKLIGFFDMRQPAYLVRDVELIRQITIRDFDSFEDHITFINSDSDTLFGNGLFSLSEKKWHDMRATLSPAFTGSKMRHMFELVVECADNMAEYFIEEAKQDKLIRWEMKELFSRYTSDVIASCAFGLKVDSLKDRTNEFFMIGKNSLNFGSVKTALRLLLIRTVPTLMKALHIEFFPAYVRKFFRPMVLDTMKEREQKQIFRPDMINILMHVRNGTLKQQPEKPGNDDAGFATVEESHIGKKQVKREWSDDEIVSQCFLFFTAGFDTASTLMSFMAYELSLNQEIQQKLYNEIREVNSKLNGSRLSYDTLPKLKYLDQVISETLRKWPPAIFTNRKCTKNYECNLDGKPISIERGHPIWIPICSIHHDALIYENPKKFDPERFSDENKHKIKPGSFIPFGSGPRNCIGSRFALMEIKALFFYLLLNFNIQPYDKTKIPVQIAKSAINWTTESGIHLELKRKT